MEGGQKKSCIDALAEANNCLTELGFPSRVETHQDEKVHKKLLFPDDMVFIKGESESPLSVIWGLNLSWDSACTRLEEEQMFLAELGVFPLGANPMQDEESFYFWLLVDCKKGATFGHV